MSRNIGLYQVCNMAELFRSMKEKISKKLLLSEKSLLLARCTREYENLPKIAVRLGFPDPEVVTPSMLQIWEILGKMGVITPENTSVLNYMLVQATNGRPEILKILEQYVLETGSLAPAPHEQNTPSGGEPMICTAVESSQRGHDLKVLELEIESELESGIVYLANHLGRDWKELFRSLGVGDCDLEIVETAYPQNLQERITQAFTLWRGLADNNDAHIGVLITMLGHIKRNGLVKDLQDGIHCRPESELESGMVYLATNLGRDWRNLLRSLGVADCALEAVVDNNPRNMREQIRQAFTYWKRFNDNHANIGMLITALSHIERNDLVRALQDGSHYRSCRD